MDDQEWAWAVEVIGSFARNERSGKFACRCKSIGVDLPPETGALGGALLGLDPSLRQQLVAIFAEVSALLHLKIEAHTCNAKGHDVLRRLVEHTSNDQGACITETANKWLLRVEWHGRATILSDVGGNIHGMKSRKIGWIYAPPESLTLVLVSQSPSQLRKLLSKRAVGLGFQPLIHPLRTKREWQKGVSCERGRLWSLPERYSPTMEGTFQGEVTGPVRQSARKIWGSDKLRRAIRLECDRAGDARCVILRTTLMETDLPVVLQALYEDTYQQVPPGKGTARTQPFQPRFPL